MGIYNRDYIHEGQSGDYFGGSAGLWAIKYLLIANGVVFILQHLTGEVRYGQVVGGITGWLSLSLEDLYTFQVWRLVTYGFCHGDLWHLLFNMFILWMFGRAVEPIYGSREFLSFFLGGVIVSGVCHVVLQMFLERPAGVIGASGGVMAVVFLTAMLYPRMKVYLMLIIPMELRWLAVLYAVADVAGMFNPTSGVAHAAHLGGAAFGIAYKYYDWRISHLGDALFWNRLRRHFRSRPGGSRKNVRLYQPPKGEFEEPAGFGKQDEFDKQVDAVLEKISKEGEASLTEQEREVLKIASRRYKKR